MAPWKTQATLSAKQGEETFRVALGLGQGIDLSLAQGIVYQIGDQTASAMNQLQQLYMDAGATEMFVRIATKRYNDDDYGDDPEHGEVHNLEVSLKYCQVAASLNLPINPEIMCAYTYMDAGTQQAPNFKEYPEIIKPDKDWSAYTLEEMCSVLEQYGALVARDVLATGCTVEYWNLGNEANFGFAGVNIGLRTAVNPELEQYTTDDMWDMENIGADFLKRNLWNYNGKMMAALAHGIRSVHPDAKFATHTEGLPNEYVAVTYFKTLLENGVDLTQAGTSLYPTISLRHIPDYYSIMKRVIRSIVSACGLRVFIAEYAYPSEAWGNFSNPVGGYEMTPKDQAKFTADFLVWCKENGVSGVRPWGPDVLGAWEPMSLFSYDAEAKVAVAKPVMDVYKKF